MAAPFTFPRKSKRLCKARSTKRAKSKRDAACADGGKAHTGAINARKAHTAKRTRQGYRKSAYGKALRKGDTEQSISRLNTAYTGANPSL